jgi:hypothetical protein
MEVKMKITCPNFNCERENVEVKNGTLANHYPSPKKTLSPDRYCPLSGTVYKHEHPPAPDPELEIEDGCFKPSLPRSGNFPLQP